jgi:hypothetical protein
LLIADHYEDLIWSYGLAFSCHGFDTTAEFGFGGVYNPKSFIYIDSKKKALSVMDLSLEVVKICAQTEKLNKRVLTGTTMEDRS